MAREIKYRAWYKYAKRMQEVLTIDFINKKVFLSADKSGIPRNYLYFDDCELMQYTGLKDKTGKEIYEGDIFETPFWVAVVEWDENNGRFLGFTVSKERRIVYVGRQPEPAKIIGNIYENPELLKHK